VIEVPKGLIYPQSAAESLATLLRRKLLNHIWQHTSASRVQFAVLYLAPLEGEVDKVTDNLEMGL
jgi:hypothetical protein